MGMYPESWHSLTPLLATLFSLALNAWLFRFGSLRLLDHPVDRSSHSVPTPRGGGLGFAAGIILALVILQPEGFGLLALTSLAIIAISFWDDLAELHQLPRVLVHFASAIFLVALLPSWPSLNPLDRLENSSLFIGFIFTGYLVWSINLYNFMDGIDGMATTQGIFISAALAVLLGVMGETEWMLLFSASALALFGFLHWNWSPARMFMGDTGSAFLGWWFAATSLLVAATTDMNLWSVMMLMSLFITDATFTLFRRFVQGEQIFNAHRSHLYQILSEEFASHKKTVWTYLAVNVLVVFPLTVLSVREPAWSAPLCAALYTGLIAVCTGVWSFTRFMAHKKAWKKEFSFGHKGSPAVFLVAADALAVIVAFMAAYLIRLNNTGMAIMDYKLLLAPLVAMCSVYVFFRMGVYKIAVRFMLNNDVWKLLVASLISSIILAASGFMTQAFMPRSIPLLYFVILLALVGGGRVFYRAIARALVKKSQIPALIVNIDGVADKFIEELNPYMSVLPVGIIDPRPELQGEVINGLKVFSPTGMEELVSQFDVRSILIGSSGIPSFVMKYWTRSGRKLGVQLYQMALKNTGNKTGKAVVGQSDKTTWSPVSVLDSIVLLPRDDNHYAHRHSRNNGP